LRSSGRVVRVVQHDTDVALQKDVCVDETLTISRRLCNNPTRPRRAETMGLELVRQSVRDRFTIEERGSACAILSQDFPSEFADILDCLDAFTLTKTHLVTAGGNRSNVSKDIDTSFMVRGWAEKSFDTKIVVDEREWPAPTHGIDNFKNRIGIEVEWNNKDPFFDRDLNNFRLLHQLNVLSVGVIITRLWELQQECKRLGRGESFGMSTTHWGKLIPKVNGGGAGGCPLLLIGMGIGCYDSTK
jgi:Restriction endonuclease BglII